MTDRELKIEKMDTALAAVIVLFIQFMVDKFADEMNEDQENTMSGFLDSLLEAYCDVIDDPDHINVVQARIDAVMDKWLEIRDGENEHPVD